VTDSDDTTPDDDSFVIVETNVVALVTHVHIYTSTIQHVVNDHLEIGRNAELPAIQGAVAKTLTAPTYVATSYNRSLVFVDEGSTNASGQPLRVAVRIVSETSARMKTFFFADGSADNVIYRKEDGNEKT
jgi:hypothetical protein